MGRKCCVNGCTNSEFKNKDQLGFFRIPAILNNQGADIGQLSQKRRRLWINQLNINPEHPGLISGHLRVCSEHFYSGSPANLIDETNADWVLKPNKVFGLVPTEASDYQANLEFQTQTFFKAQAGTPSDCQLQLPFQIKADIPSDCHGFPVVEEASNPKSSVNENLRESPARETKDVAVQTYFGPDFIKANWWLPKHKSLPTRSNVKQKVNIATQTLFRVTETFELEALMFKLKDSEKLIEDLNSKLKIQEGIFKKCKEDLETKISEVEAHKQIYYNEEYFEGNNEKVKYFTGLANFEQLLEINKEIEPFLSKGGKVKLSPFQQTVLTIMKLRLGASNRDLAYRFGVSDRTVGRIFYKTLDTLYVCLKAFIVWPDRDVLQATMPTIFREKFGKKVAVILYCFEVFMDKPSSVIAQAETCSNYKHHTTIKFLIGITPQGSISFISKGFDGSVSDNHLTETSGLLDKLLPGDLVLADRGFDMEDSVRFYCASLKLSTFTKGKRQLDPFDVEATRKLAKVRIHVERVISALRQKYKILHSQVAIELNCEAVGEELDTIDKVTTVACALTNLFPSVAKVV